MIQRKISESQSFPLLQLVLELVNQFFLHTRMDLVSLYITKNVVSKTYYLIRQRITKYNILLPLRLFKLTLESMRTISMVSPPAAEYCFHSLTMLTFTLHMVLKGFKSATELKPAISFLCLLEM